MDNKQPSQEEQQEQQKEKELLLSSSESFFGVLYYFSDDEEITNKDEDPTHIFVPSSKKFKEAVNKIALLEEKDPGSEDTVAETLIKEYNKLRRAVVHAKKEFIHLRERRKRKIAKKSPQKDQ